jgi:hypothetical protein
MVQPGLTWKYRTTEDPNWLHLPSRSWRSSASRICGGTRPVIEPRKRLGTKLALNLHELWMQLLEQSATRNHNSERWQLFARRAR